MLCSGVDSAQGMRRVVQVGGLQEQVFSTLRGCQLPTHCWALPAEPLIHRSGVGRGQEPAVLAST